MRRIHSFTFYFFTFTFVLASFYMTFIYVVNMGHGINKYTIYEPDYPPYRPEREIGACTVTIPIDYFPFIFYNYNIVYEVNVMADIEIVYSHESYKSGSCAFQATLISHNIYNHQFVFSSPVANNLRYILPNNVNDGKVQPFRAFANRGYYEIIRTAKNGLKLGSK